MIESKVCRYCYKEFAPNKYSPHQKVCSNPECQHTRQLESMKSWRSSNPNYFKYDESKGVEWLQAQRERSRQWRHQNPEKVQSYRQSHIDEYRNYMRDYMRRYREKLKQKSSPDSSASSPDTSSANGSLPPPSV